MNNCQDPGKKCQKFKKWHENQEAKHRLMEFLSDLTEFARYLQHCTAFLNNNLDNTIITDMI